MTRRYRFGSITVTALCDGQFALATHDVLRAGQGPLDVLLGQARLDDIVPSHVNAFLIDDGKHRTLIDVGAGDLQDDTLGQMQARLEAAGHGVDDIDTILLTHLHPDHIGGLTRRGEAVFPRATVHVAGDEARFWMGESARDDVDASVVATFAHARTILRPYMDAGRYRTFEPRATWHGYLRAEALAGHTPGHTGYRLRMDTGDVIFCGDLFHVAGVQLADPSVTVRYDSHPAQAHSAREAFLAKACARGDLVAAAHAPFPGIGSVARGARGYAWIPLSD
ncbi:MBL fold metallo-hydrolase [Luteibacter sp. CQ10]|uniref:MBL fold metallo-hydrolase n=1 Tax=Luteibacter sp. CQ10 TaxID=2805821 RepID=UPI0034A22B05